MTLVAALTLLGPPALSVPQAAAAAGCAGAQHDFNGDGIRDSLIADPEATVSGKERAGQIHVVYGGGKGTFALSQDSPNVSDSAETDDRFGFSSAVYDANLDGCSDIAVGIPFEDINAADGPVEDAGLVHLIYGSPTGIAPTGVATIGFRQGADGRLGGTYEAEDWAGHAVAAGTSATGIPFLVIGVPGADSDEGVDTGMFHHVYGTGYNVAHVSQDSAGVWEDPEPHDRFGASIAATDRHFVVGAPGESIATTSQNVGFAGAVVVFRPSINTDGIPDPLFGMGQGRSGSADTTAQAGDQYGTSLAMAPYRPAGSTTNNDSLLAVGVPGEDLAATVDAGAVHTYDIRADGTLQHLKWIDQNHPDVEGAAEAGDFFGQRLAAANTSPSATGTAATMRLAVAAPGEESTEEYPEEGGVHVLPLLGEPGAGDSWIAPGDGIPAVRAPRMLTGMGLGSSPTSLYVGVPYGPDGSRAVHAFPWNTPNGGAPTQSWRPGEGGIPAGSVAFGAYLS
ncbi:VCBS repeat-containing protein [Streptomyces sp. NBC_00683]|uniref:VCBS repeat-containing protein n=1 Tax=Streptomyces sp. NBC_00683 TaxID=2903670 RepID=UPI002E33F2E4|nr:VCBS repeat-containing protein [Streptomyces sp. NBC_00683]